MKTRLSVKAIRVNLGLSREQMVESLKEYGIEMSLVTYSDKERGSVDWKWAEIKAISKLSGINENLIA